MVLVVLLSGGSTAWARISIQASVDRQSLPVDENLEFTVVVTYSGLGGIHEPELPDFSNDFVVLSRSTQKSYSVENTTINTSLIFSYMLRPRRTGELTISAVTVRDRDNTYRSTPVTVRVVDSVRAGTPPAAPGALPPGRDRTTEGVEAARISHKVNTRRAFVGQQVTYTFEFFQALRLYGDVEYIPAATNGFIAEELPNPAATQEQIGGRYYAIQRRQKALFATSPGRLTIGEAQVGIITEPTGGRTILKAEPITVEIMPLPDKNRPADFSGAVGRYTIAAEADKKQAATGEEITVTVTITGTGDMNAFSPPKLNIPEEQCRTFTSGDQREFLPGGGGSPANLMGGTAVFTYVLIPRQTGSLSVPPVTFNFFDPRTEEYRTVRSKPLEFVITQGALVDDTGPGEDALALVPQARFGPQATLPVTSHLWFLIMYLLPAAGLAWAAFMRIRAVRLAANPRLARSVNARAVAYRRFEAAEKALDADDIQQCYRELHGAFSQYIADRFGVPPAGLAKMEVRRILEEAGNPHIAETAHNLLVRTAALRFGAPIDGQQAAREVVSACRECVDEIDRQVKPPHVYV